MSSISSRVLLGSVWVSFARIFVNLLTLISTFVLAWVLTPGDFGVVAIASTVIFVISVATEISLASALVRHPSPDASHLSAAWTLNTIRGLLLFLATCALAWPIATFFKEPRLTLILCVFGFSLFISGLVNPRMAMAQRDLQFRQEFIVQTGQKLVGFCVGVGWAFYFRNYWALVAGSLASQATNVILSYYVMPFRPRIVFKYFHEFFSFSGWMWASQVVNTLNWRFDGLIIGKVFGADIVGFYNMGSNLAQLPTREAILPLTQPLFPAFVNLRVDRARLAAAYQRVQTIVTAVALPIGVGTALIAEPLVRFALGNQWLPSVPIVQAFAAIGALQTMGSLAQPLAMALDHTRSLFYRDAALLALRLITFIGAAFTFGLAGIIAARVGMGFVTITINLLLVRKLTAIRLRDQLFINGRTLLATCVMIIAVLAVSHALSSPSAHWHSWAKIGVLITTGGIAYLASIVMLWVASGKPEGAETEVGQLFRQAIKSLRNRAKRQG